MYKAVEELGLNGFPFGSQNPSTFPILVPLCLSVAVITEKCIHHTYLYGNILKHRKAQRSNKLRIYQRYLPLCLAQAEIRWISSEGLRHVYSPVILSIREMPNDCM